MADRTRAPAAAGRRPEVAAVRAHSPSAFGRRSLRRRGLLCAGRAAPLLASALLVAAVLAGCAPAAGGAAGATVAPTAPIPAAPTVAAPTMPAGLEGAAGAAQPAPTTTPAPSASGALGAPGAPGAGAPAATPAASAPYARMPGPGRMPMMMGGASRSTPSPRVDATPGTLATPSAPTPAAATSAQLYTADCAVCHGTSRQGGPGPALLPSTLTGDASYYVSVVEYGAPGTLMPGWLAQGLTADRIRALVEYLRAVP